MKVSSLLSVCRLGQNFPLGFRLLEKVERSGSDLGWLEKEPSLELCQLHTIIDDLIRRFDGSIDKDDLAVLKRADKFAMLQITGRIMAGARENTISC